MTARTASDKSNAMGGGWILVIERRLWDFSVPSVADLAACQRFQPLPKIMTLHSFHACESRMRYRPESPE